MYTYVTNVTINVPFDYKFQWVRLLAKHNECSVCCSPIVKKPTYPDPLIKILPSLRAGRRTVPVRTLKGQP